LKGIELGKAGTDSASPTMKLLFADNIKLIFRAKTVEDTEVLRDLIESKVSLFLKLTRFYL
jgi:hypothetical protein